MITHTLRAPARTGLKTQTPVGGMPLGYIELSFFLYSRRDWLRLVTCRLTRDPLRVPGWSFHRASLGQLLG